MEKMYINANFTIEFFIHLFVIMGGLFTVLYFLKMNWKKFGLLFLLAALLGNVLCYLFVKLGFYSYPYVLFPGVENMPILPITFAFPAAVLVSVRYSPEKWAWKIPYYWTIVHIGMLFETWGLVHTDLIRYNFEWDFWDSYTWWWIFFLLFEWLGSLIVPQEFRNPIDQSFLSYGRLGWAIIHFVLIVTIFLGGYYLGRMR